jgi:uncharacterized protein (DUF433 family)
MNERISVDPKICHGQACIRGTRIPVHQVIRMLANGDEIEDLLEDYPSLKIQDIFCMKIFADENIPLVTVKELRAKGFDVADIRGTSEQGMPDEELWLKVQEEKRLLITTDKGFSKHRTVAMRDTFQSSWKAHQL